jgi:predicted RND superfamily exporter protein
MNNFRSVEELLILAESDSVEPEQLLAFARRLDDAIKADPVASKLSDGVIYRVDPQQRKFFEQVLVPAGLFYLDDAAFEAAKQRLTRENMLAQLRRNESLIAAPGPAAQALSKVLLKDPLRLHEFLLERFTAGRPFQTYQGSDAFLSADGRALLIRIRGRRPVNDLEFAKRFTATVDAIAKRVNTDRLRVDLSGAYAIAAASERAVRRGMIGSVIGSVIGLQLLFVLAYRRPARSFLLAFTPVALGVLYGFGAYALLVSRQLTPMTAVIGGVLAGMAIDYAIAFLSYYQSARPTASDAAHAAITARKRIGAAILAAWATSIVGFIAVVFSRVSALRDFAILGALGLTGAFVCAITLLPALLALWDRRGDMIAESKSQHTPVAALVNLLSARPRACLCAGVLLFALALVILLLPGPLLPLESDLSVMHPRPNAPLQTQDRIARRMGTSPGSFILHLRADDPDQLLRVAHRAEERLRSSEIRATGIVGTFGLATLLPDPAKGQARINATGPTVADRVVADFDAAITQTMFDRAAYEPYAQFLRTMLTNTHPPGVAELLCYPSLADNILPASAFGSGATLPTEAITLVLVREGSERREPRDAQVGAIRTALGDLPGVTLTGLSVINHDTEQSVRRDLPRLVFAAVAVAMLYLIAQFRNVTECLLATLPTIFGLACLLAFMRLTGQKLNMINLIAFPLLVGIDVDYGIFLTAASRRRELAGLTRAQLLDRFHPAAAAVLLCAASTMIGFGSLAFTSIPAVQSLGVAVIVGVTSCVIGTFFLVLPTLLLLARRSP